MASEFLFRLRNQRMGGWVKKLNEKFDKSKVFSKLTNPSLRILKGGLNEKAQNLR